MKLLLLASMASCAAASIMKPNFSNLLSPEKARRLDDYEDDDDDDDGPNCNGPKDCDDDDFCAIPEGTSSHHVRRRLFADFEHYDGFCASPVCMKDNEAWYGMAASGLFDGSNLLSAFREQGFCTEGGTFDEWIEHSSANCDVNDLNELEGYKTLACDYGMACDFPEDGMPTTEFCSECKDPLLSFINDDQNNDEEEKATLNTVIPLMCQCPGFAAENLIEDSSGNLCVFNNETPECQDMIKAGMGIFMGGEDMFMAHVGLCACNGEWDTENPDFCGLNDKDTICQEAVRSLYIAYNQVTPKADGTMPTPEEAATMYEDMISAYTLNCA